MTSPRQGEGPEEGLSVPCAASFDSLQPIRRSYLTERTGSLDPARRPELCRALRALAGLLTA